MSEASASSFDSDTSDLDAKLNVNYPDSQIIATRLLESNEGFDQRILNLYKLTEKRN